MFRCTLRQVSDIVIQSHAVGWSRAGVARRFAWRSLIGSSLVSMLTLAFAIPLDSGALGLASFFILAAFASGAMVGIAGLVRTTRGRGRLAIVGAEVVVQTEDRTWHRPIAEIEGGWVEDPAGIRLRMKDGTVVAAEASDGPTAEAALRAAGVSVSQRVLGVALTSAASRTPLGVPIAVVCAALTGLAIVFFWGVIGLGVQDLLRHGKGAAVVGLVFLAIIMAILCAVFAGILESLRRRTVTIGVDGVAILRDAAQALHPLLGDTGHEARPTRRAPGHDARRRRSHDVEAW